MYVYIYAGACAVDLTSSTDNSNRARRAGQNTLFHEIHTWNDYGRVFRSFILLSNNRKTHTERHTTERRTQRDTRRKTQKNTEQKDTETYRNKTQKDTYRKTQKDTHRKTHTDCMTLGYDTTS